MHLVGIEAHDLCRRDRCSEEAEHRPGVKAAGHDRRDPVRRHALHHFVARGHAGDERASWHLRILTRDQRGGDDRGARMREHAEGVPLAAGVHHLRVRERGAALGDLRARHHDGAAVPDAGFLFRDERHRLFRGRHLRPEQCGRQVLQREPLGAINDGRGQILVAQTNDPFRELPAERLRRLGARRRRARLLRPRGDRYGPQPHASGNAGRHQRRLAQKCPSIPLGTTHAHDSVPFGA